MNSDNFSISISFPIYISFSIYISTSISYSIPIHSSISISDTIWCGLKKLNFSRKWPKHKIYVPASAPNFVRIDSNCIFILAGTEYPWNLVKIAEKHWKLRKSEEFRPSSKSSIRFQSRNELGRSWVH